MKHLLPLVSFLLAGGLAALSGADLSIRPLSGAIDPDGKLTEKEWQRKADIATFFPFRFPPAEGRPVKTRIYLTYDARNIYVGIHCDEPAMSRIKAKAVKHDEPAWQDDSVELFFVPSAKKQTYVQIVVNPNGTVFDLLREDEFSKTDLSWKRITIQ